MSGGNELLPVGQYGNYKKLVETATSSVVAEMTAAWLQPSTESIGLLAASTAVIGHVIADASTVKIGALQPSTSAIGLVEIGRQYNSITATVTTSTDGLSGAVDLAGYGIVGIMMSTAWTAASLTFVAAASSGSTFMDVYDDANNEVTIGTTGNRAVGIDFAAGSLAPWRWLKLRSGTSATPVAQAASRTLTLIVKG